MRTAELRSSARQPDHFQQHRFAGIDQLLQRDARKTLAPERPAARQRRDVNEGGEAGAEPGGYCRTIERDGFVWDYSGHFSHFKEPAIEALADGRTISEIAQKHDVHRTKSPS